MCLHWSGAYRGNFGNPGSSSTSSRSCRFTAYRSVTSSCDGDGAAAIERHRVCHSYAAYRRCSGNSLPVFVSKAGAQYRLNSSLRVVDRLRLQGHLCWRSASAHYLTFAGFTITDVRRKRQLQRLTVMPDLVDGYYLSRYLRAQRLQTGHYGAPLRRRNFASPVKSHAPEAFCQLSSVNARAPLRATEPASDDRRSQSCVASTADASPPPARVATDIRAHAVGR